MEKSKQKTAFQGLPKVVLKATHLALKLVHNVP